MYARRRSAASPCCLADPWIAPTGASTSVTSAPRSPSSIEAYGPGVTIVEDRGRTATDYDALQPGDLVGTTGRKYTGRGVTNESFDLAPGEDYFLRVRNRLIAQGEDGGDDDFFFIQVIRFHVTPNGDIQQDFSELSFECK